MPTAAQVDGGGGHTAFKLHAAPDRLEVLLPCVLFGVRSQVTDAAQDIGQADSLACSMT